MKPYTNGSRARASSWNSPRSAGAHYLHAKYNAGSTRRLQASADGDQIVHRIREFRAVARMRHTATR